MLSIKRKAKAKKVPIVKRKANANSLKCNETLNDTCLSSKEIHNNKNTNITQSITQSMRAVLIDWVMQVSSEFQFHRITFHLSVSLIDKYLKQTDIQKEKFQLLGITALFIAHKIQEVDILQITMFQDVTNGGFTSQDIIEMQQIIYVTLKWRVSSQTVYHCLTSTLKSWDQYISQTEYQHTKYYKSQQNHFNTISNILDYLLFHFNLFKPKNLIYALIFCHLNTIQTSSCFKSIFNLFLKQAQRPPLKNIKQQIEWIKCLIPQTTNFCSLQIPKNDTQPYTSYISMFSQYINS